MAIYYLGVKSFGRSAGTGGSVSTSAAAYRAGERIRDERTDRVYDHSHRRDVQYKEILLPSHFDDMGSQLDWARDRSRLWNAVEHSEPRANARVAREYVLALPHELNVEQRTVLARTFAREISDRYGNAVDLAIHQPRTDPRNFHAHLLSTTRELNAFGFGAKTIAELSGSARFEQGLPRPMQEHALIRKRWADMTNEALHAAGLEVRVSHIPDSEALIRPEARAWLPRVAWEIERRGEHSVLGARARDLFAQRREAAIERSAAALSPVRGARKSPEEIRKHAIEEWRAIRAQVTHGGSARAAPNEVASRQGDLERQTGSLRRELGRDDFAL
ncbi:MAG TPA: MobA/MobL family protein [Steroidobacteraceae bacterium]